MINMSKELIEIIGKPTSIIEFTYLTEALWKRKNFQNLKEVIREAQKDKMIASSVVFDRIRKKMDDARHG